MKRILSFMGKYRTYGIIAALCVMGEAACELIVPFIMADMVDVGVANGDKPYIFQRGILMAVFAVIAFLLGITSAKFAAKCGQGLGAELRKEEYRKLQGFSFGNMDHFQNSSLITRLTSDITTIQNSVSTGMRPAFRAPIMMFLAVGLAFSISGKLAVIFLVALPVLAVLLFTIIFHVRPLYSRMQGAIDLVNRIIQENLTAIRVVKAYVRGEHEIEKFNEVNENLQGISEKAFRLAVLNMPVMQYVIYATILAILWFGGNMIMVGGMKVGELTGVLSYVMQILNSLMMISNVFMMMTRALASGRRVLEVIDEEPEIKDNRESTACVEKGGIVFDHVWFKYRKDAPEYVLSDISFEIQPGQTVGIIGQTGSAKSTLVQLIPRLYEATKGGVLVDGREVGAYSLEHLRDAVAVVLQKNTLFSGTIRENLKWGNPNADEQELDRACRIARVDEFLDRLPGGYDMELGQGGSNVSGGQKQRLCIARAILKKPKVLIMDDSTSAVDTATEAAIQKALKEELPDMTKIIIAQRISSVEQADKILVLQDGHLLASGTHQELMEDCGLYREIAWSQKREVG